MNLEEGILKAAGSGKPFTKELITFCIDQLSENNINNENIINGLNNTIQNEGYFFIDYLVKKLFTFSHYKNIDFDKINLGYGDICGRLLSGSESNDRVVEICKSINTDYTRDSDLNYYLKHKKPITENDKKYIIDNMFNLGSISKIFTNIKLLKALFKGFNKDDVYDKFNRDFIKKINSSYFPISNSINNIIDIKLLDNTIVTPKKLLEVLYDRMNGGHVSHFTNDNINYIHSYPSIVKYIGFKEVYLYMSSKGLSTKELMESSVGKKYQALV